MLHEYIIKGASATYMSQSTTLTSIVEYFFHSNLYKPPKCRYEFEECDFVKTPSGTDIACQLVSTDPKVKERWNARNDYIDDRVIYLFSHGNACDMKTAYIDWLLKLDGNVLKWDYPGYGQSTDENVCENGIFEAVETVYRLCVAMKVPADKLVIVGQSLGSVPALFLASKCYVRHRAVILVSPLASAYRTIFSVKYIPNRLCGYMDSLLFNNVKYASSVRVPVAIIHGVNDDIVDVDHVNTLLSNVSPRQRYKPLLLKAKHNDIFDFPNDADINTYLMRFMKYSASYRQHTTPYDDVGVDDTVVYDT